MTDEAGERRKLATFLFCDLSGSTAMGERLDPETVRDVMFRYFREMRIAIERHGGTVDKFIGDAVVAIFGVPVVHEDDALRALRAALAMQERLAALNDQLETEFGHRLAIRIGVNTGEVVAGASTAQQTIVLGDAVNLAARLEQAAEPGEVLLGGMTYRLARDAIGVEPLEPLTLKGKADPVPAYRLLSVSARPRLHERLMRLTLGRQVELARLYRLFDDAVSGSTCVLATVVAQAGMGKSHLVARFVADTGDRARVVRGHCLSYGEGITFWPIAEIVREAAEIQDDDTPEHARARILKLLAGTDDAETIAAAIAQAIGLSVGAAPAEEIAWAIRRLFETLARDRPLILVIEDIHWAEPALLDLLAGLPDLAREARIFLLCLARPELSERRPDWVATMELGPLTPDEAARLVEELLPEKAMPLELLKRVVAAADGNPLFLEELVQMLIDDELLHDGERGADGSKLTQLTIPPTINALLNARLDRLRSAERAALERGAVEGPVFHRRALEELSAPEARPELATQLETLVQKELIAAAKAAPTEDEAFQFLHALIRDAAYQTTPKKLRADLHERFAAWLEAAAGARLLEYEELLGFHLEQAYHLRAELGPVGERDREVAARAAEHLSASAHRARIRGDSTAAVNLLSRTLALLDDADRRRPELLLNLAKACVAVGDLARADDLLAEAFEAAEQVGDVAVAASASVERASVRFFRDPTWSAEELFATAEHAASVAEDAGDDLGVARALHKIALAHLVNGRYGLCSEALRRALEHAEAAEAEIETRSILNMLGMALWFGPAPVGEAAAQLQAALEQAEGQPVREAGLAAPLAGLRAMEGRFDEARVLLARARRIFGDLGLRGRFAETALIVAAVETLAGDLPAAEAGLREGYELLDALGEKAVRSTVAAFLASALAEGGRDDEAERFLETAETTAAGDDVVTQARLKTTRARILARQGSLEEAAALAAEAVRLTETTDALDEQATALRDLAEVEALAGDAAKASASLRKALRLHAAKGNRVAAASAAATLDRLEAVAEAVASDPPLA